MSESQTTTFCACRPPLSKLATSFREKVRKGSHDPIDCGLAHFQSVAHSHNREKVTEDHHVPTGDPCTFEELIPIHIWNKCLRAFKSPPGYLSACSLLQRTSIGLEVMQCLHDYQGRLEARHLF